MKRNDYAVEETFDPKSIQSIAEWNEQVWLASNWDDSNRIALGWKGKGRFECDEGTEMDDFPWGVSFQIKYKTRWFNDVACL